VYVSRRTRDWLKFKCIQEQEFLIGGYTNPRGERVGFGALLVGFYRRGKLVAQIGFTEWTDGDKLRHPRFLGLREDKRPEEVVREG
jgi:ATP-dependent DNA ligase